MKKITSILPIISFTFILFCCSNDKNVEQNTGKTGTVEKKTPVILDTDANNELDDQHAIAYLVFNSKAFNILGITVNTTYSGGNIDMHYAEALRVLQLCSAEDKIPLKKGADAGFHEIIDSVQNKIFDGSEAVDFIIDKVKSSHETITLVPIGKLTNIALALAKEPSIAPKVRIVWLGSNYPNKGEYNQVNDTAAMNYILNTDVNFEIVTVRYRTNTGSTYVRVSQDEINKKMPGSGPHIPQAVIGRHGGQFHCFGDYSVNLFEHIEYHDSTKQRSLFDVVALAVVKEPTWGEQKETPAPIYVNDQWIERPENKRQVIIWENFNKEKIIDDFYKSIIQ